MSLITLKGNMYLSESIKCNQLNFESLKNKNIGTIFIQNVEQCFEYNKKTFFSGHDVTIRIHKVNNEWILSECKIHSLNKKVDLFLINDVQALIY